MNIFDDILKSSLCSFILGLLIYIGNQFIDIKENWMEIVTVLKTIYAVVKGFCIMNWIIGILYKSMSLLIIGIIYMNYTFTESIPQSEEVSGG